MISNLFPVVVFLYSHSKTIKPTVMRPKTLIGLNPYGQRKKCFQILQKRQSGITLAQTYQPIRSNLVKASKRFP